MSAENKTTLALCEFEEKIVKCTKWLEETSTEDCESVCTSEFTESEYSEFDDGVLMTADIKLGEESDDNGNNVDMNPRQKNITNISIYKSKYVDVGTKVYIKRPVFINRQELQKTKTRKVPFLKIEETDSFPVVSRRAWVAEPPREEIYYIKEPAKFVIILHSATEQPTTQAEAIDSIRHMQSFHINRGMGDIAYNFMISMGFVFEGRGWAMEGCNARGYNSRGVGICFLGCFIREVPSRLSLKKAQGLIEYGVQIGAIAEDYKLVGHCQCSGTESPGNALFEEIKTWKNWDGTISVENPSPIIFET